MAPVIQFVKKPVVPAVKPSSAAVGFQVYTEHHLDKIEALKKLSAQQRFEMKVVARVLPFRVNQYVIDELIDWHNIPDDPVFQLTFPQKGMLSTADFEQMAEVLKSNSEHGLIQKIVNDIRKRLILTLPVSNY